MSAVPTLRFGEFEGDWVYSRFSKMFQVGSGRDYKHLGAGNVPVFGTGGVMAHVDDSLYDGVSVGIGRKGTIDKPTLMSGKFWTVDTLFYTHSFSNVIPEFLYAMFLRVNWKKHNEASGVPSLSKTTIESLKERFPSLPEQKKIADFLGAVDDKIAGLRERERLLIQYKKGVMQKIFSQDLRFKADDGSDFPDWEEKRVDQVFKITRGNVLAMPETSTLPIGNKVYPVYSSQTKQNGLAGYYDQYLYENAITWTTDGANAGETNYRSGKFYCTNVCGVLLNDNGHANAFTAAMLNSVSRRYVSYVGNPKLMNNVMGSIKIMFPHPNEQQKIADFLSAIDAKIIAVSAQITQMQDFKKGLLQQMFV